MGLYEKVFKSNRYKPEYADSYSDVIYSDNRSYKVNEEQAMQIAAVKASVELISSTISSLPIYLYEEMINGDLNDVNDKRVALLNDKANKYDTAAKTKKLLVKDLLFYGRAYLYKKNDMLYYLEASKITTRGAFEEDGIVITKKEYVYNGRKTQVIPEDQIIEFSNGTAGILIDGESILNQAINELEYTKGIMSNGAMPLGVLKAASRLTEKAIVNLKENFQNLYGGSHRAGKTIVLEEGLDYKPISLNPNELQLNETSKHTLASITRLFNVPQALIDSSANKYASLEMQNMQFLQYTVSPILDVIESTLNQRLLKDYEQKGGLYFRFDTSEILRVTEKELVETTVRLLEKGVITKNEARAKLDYKRVEKDVFMYSMGTVSEDAKTEELTIPNMGIIKNKQILGGEATHENGTENEPDNS